MVTYKFPHPKNASAMTGTIQCTEYSAVHPNKNNEAGIITDPIMAMQSRASGATALPILTA
jgi:hypothetical protein